MFEWIHRIAERFLGDGRQKIIEPIGLLTTAYRGEPVTITTHLGSLKLRSGTLTVREPRYLFGIQVPNINAEVAEISATLLKYPSGAERVKALRVTFGNQIPDISRRKIGEIDFDMSKIVVADDADIEEHWANEGQDRIGVISSPLNDEVLRLLTKQFHFKAVRVNPVRAEVVGPVSDKLAQEIKAFLKSDPRYAAFPYAFFRVETNNSFDRVIHLEKTWDFIPVGNTAQPEMFVSHTGCGNDCYDIHGEFDGDTCQGVSVTFIKD